MHLQRIGSCPISLGLPLLSTHLKYIASEINLTIVHTTRHILGRFRAPWRSILLRHFLRLWNKCHGYRRSKYGRPNQGFPPAFKHSNLTDHGPKGIHLP